MTPIMALWDLILLRRDFFIDLVLKSEKSTGFPLLRE